MAFKAEILKIAESVGQKLEDMQREVLFEIGSSVVMRTPVGDPSYWKSKPPKGYAGGRARGSWQYNFGTPGAQSINIIDKTGSASILRIAGSINPLPGLHFITSNLEYMQRLEEGYSQQAPQGMVQLTVIDFSGIVDIAVQKVKK